ncbi:MAG: hypothetical protein OEU54_09915 [Gemmatimonadota bacterium]|nr:hypothetical protein [Gemmatimonadota bacterium]
MNNATTDRNDPLEEPLERAVRPRHVSAGVAARMEEALSERACQEQRERRERIEKAEEIQRGARERIVELFGAEHYAQWRQFASEKRRERSRPRTPVADSEALEEERDGQIAAARTEGAGMLREWGVSAEDVVALAAEAGDGIMSVLRPTVAVADEELVIRPGRFATLSHDDDAGLVINVATPPYGNQGGSSSFPSGGPFEVSVTPQADAMTGVIGQGVRVENYDAGDADFITAIDHRFVRGGVIMPQSGQLVLSIDLTVLRSGHRLKVVDEFGVSHCDSIQKNEIQVNVIGADGVVWEVRKQMMRWRKATNQYLYRFFEQFDDGTPFNAGFVSGRSYAESEFVLFEIGSRTTNEVLANDMEVDGKVTYRYRVDQVVTGVLHQ